VALVPGGHRRGRHLARLHTARWGNFWLSLMRHFLSLPRLPDSVYGTAENVGEVRTPSAAGDVPVANP